MRLFKKRLTEDDAAKHFVADMLLDAREHWPAIYDNLRNYDENFVVEDEAACNVFLAVAAMALDLEAVAKIFNKKQSERIINLVVSYLNDIDEGGYIVKEVRKHTRTNDRLLRNLETRGYLAKELKSYQQCFNRAISNTENPIDFITLKLLDCWLAVSVSDTASQKEMFADPILTSLINAYLAAFTGFWKEIDMTFKLVKK